MAHKHLLHELLKEEQEPFHLKSYIAERLSQIREPSPRSALQVKKRKPIIDSSVKNSKRSSICKNACLFSFQNSPEFRRSPFLNFQSPGKSPCKSPNRAVFLQIPAKTAVLLLEAAMRIQTKQSKRKTPVKNVFGSILKRLKDSTKNRIRMLGVDDNAVKLLRKNEPKIDKNFDMNIRISCSCNISRTSSVGWSSSNEEKCTDLETCTSSCSEETECIAEGMPNGNGDYAFSEKRFCSRPFRFSLQKSPSSSARRTPDFTSPAASPRRHKKGEKANGGTKILEKVLGKGEEEGGREQCSPVSVLYPPFEEDDGHESANVDEENSYDPDCSYANVQRAKQQLLYRLCRFEKLAELDPMELERKLLEGSDDDEQKRSEACKDEPFEMFREHSMNSFSQEVFSISNLEKVGKIATDMKRLASDLITEQKSEMDCLRSNEEVFDTIDMMIELAFKQESDGWLKFPEEGEETAAEIEVSIFGLLVEELSEELCY